MALLNKLRYARSSYFLADEIASGIQTATLISVLGCSLDRQILLSTKHNEEQISTFGNNLLVHGRQIRITDDS